MQNLFISKAKKWRQNLFISKAKKVEAKPFYKQAEKGGSKIVSKGQLICFLVSKCLVNNISAKVPKSHLSQ